MGVIVFPNYTLSILEKQNVGNFRIYRNINGIRFIWTWCCWFCLLVNKEFI